MKTKLWLSLSAGVIAGILGTSSAAHAQRIFQTDVSGPIITTGDLVYGLKRDLVYINEPVDEAVQLEAEVLEQIFLSRDLNILLTGFPPNIDDAVQNILYSVLIDDANADQNATLIFNALVESGANADEAEELVSSLRGLLDEDDVEPEDDVESEDYVEPEDYQDAIENFNELLITSNDSLFTNSPQILFAIHSVLFRLNQAAYVAAELEDDNDD